MYEAKTLRVCHHMVIFDYRFDKGDTVKLKDGRMGAIEKIYLISSTGNGEDEKLFEEGKTLYAQLCYEFENDEEPFHDDEIVGCYSECKKIASNRDS